MTPEEPQRPDSHDVMVDFMNSIAMEEIAISHLLNAEAKKMQAFVGKELDFPTNPSNVEIFQFNKEAARFIETLVIKEWLLLRKFQSVSDYFSKRSESSLPSPPPSHPSPPCEGPLEM
ncbi:hypothetical protein [Neobacillus kokaensis]|uniref:Uncharacterized protein n=1 Tax=Neobacillus kokaensis TaxID=2759023 RepID=A0ABQ3MWV1_9BACI|nr:hypothetical protein [Neobacillus kokaensis]GHH96902.1 hypothetical protein AM1BK_04450 [Neobacillus kokaensis]